MNYTSFESKKVVVVVELFSKSCTFAGIAQVIWLHNLSSIPINLITKTLTEYISILRFFFCLTVASEQVFPDLSYFLSHIDLCKFRFEKS